MASTSNEYALITKWSTNGKKQLTSEQKTLVKIANDECEFTNEAEISGISRLFYLYILYYEIWVI